MRVPDACVPFIGFQRTNYVNIKRDFVIDLKNEFKQMVEFLPVDCDSIIDIGCGVAGIDIFLNQYYGKVLFFLIDRNENPDKKTYGFSDKTSFYNSFDAIKELLTKNNVSDFVIVEPDKRDSIPKEIDVIISLLACGFHFHINNYLEFILKRLKNDGVLILDIRKTKIEQVKILHKVFKNINEIQTTNPKTIRICAKGRI